MEHGKSALIRLTAYPGVCHCRRISVTVLPIKVVKQWFGYLRSLVHFEACHKNEGEGHLSIRTVWTSSLHVIGNKSQSMG